MANEGEAGGIRAKHIDATNVVEGLQIRGGDAQAAERLVGLARAIRRGSVTADAIKAENLVSGLQFITDPVRATPGDLRREVAALRERVDQAVAAGEFADSTDAEDVQDALAQTEEDLAAPEPRGNRVLRKVDEVNDILTQTAEAAEKVGNLHAQVINLAPIAATIWQVAQRLFSV